MNNVVLIGRIVRDVELRYVPVTGTAVAKFSIAVDRGLSKEQKLEAEKNNKAVADFINIIAWGKTAEYIANYTEKGKLIGIQGRIQTGSYEKDGQRIYTTDVVADKVEILEWKDKTPGFQEIDMQEEIPF